jgi:hypothetical protein
MFADGFAAVDEGDSQTKHYDPITLKKDLDTAHETMTRNLHDPVRAFVEGLEKNKLLLCFDQSMGKNKIETLAHHCISALAQVGYCAHYSAVYICFSLTPFASFF